MSNNAQTDSAKNIQIGNSISSWEGLDPVTPYLHLEAPPIDDSAPTSPPNQSKYPNVVGTQRLAVTDSARNIRKRSWMGWFLWGDGTPPPGITPGYPATESSPPQYNDDNWDYFSWQYSAGYSPSDPSNNGQWKAVRLDQQPLYLNPFRINSNWPAGKFGYQKQPLQAFPNNVGYWKDKKIVRGPNLSLAYPYMVEYADYVDKTKSPDFPDEWRNSWLYVHTRPLETLVMVPGIKTPAELLTAGTWNQVGNDHQPFPYPVWDEILAPADQTPFCLKVDRMGDWDADLIWEGTHANAQNYDQNKYQPTAFNESGKGNYLKMTVAQGSPLVWCETNNSQYINFYNLIRTNEPDHIDNTDGTRPTNAGMAIDAATQQGVWDVPGVSDVQYVLLYGNQTNPNQFYHEVEPFKWDEQTGLPGGWNPPGKQSNHTYIAIYFRKGTVVPVDLSQHSGTDSDGNPYFYLEFANKNQKNWYVVGAIPVMRYYYPSEVIAEDDESTRLTAARQWAEAMGGYAFNFLTDTKIAFDVENMYKATTTYQTSLTNPYQAIGQANAELMTLDSSQTIIALMPHHYQPITLGPDYTQPIDPNQPDANQVVWQPLQTVGADLPVGSIYLPNANKSSPDAKSCWGYWSPRGNLKTLATGSFTTEFLFQNFLPLLPPPNWEKEYPQTSVQGVRVVNVGTGYEKLPTDVDVPTEGALPKATIVSPSGSGAQLKVILQPYTDKIQQIDVVYGGSGYPDGNPPANVTVHIDAPDSRISGGRIATARAQVGGGKVLAIFMNDQGAGYRSTIQVSIPNEEATDPAIILPLFTGDGKSLLKGLGNVVVGGAGWVNDPSTPIAAEVCGTGTGATAEVIKPGQILQVRDSGIGGFTADGMYPSSGNPDTDAQSITVHVPPPAPGKPAQTMRVAEVNSIPGYFKTLITDPGAGYAITDQTSVLCVTSDNHSFSLINIEHESGRILSADLALQGMSFTDPFEVTFQAAAGKSQPQGEAKGIVYSGFSVQAVELTGETISGYEEDMQISFSGGDFLPPGLVMPEFTYEIGSQGQITNVSLKSTGSGFFRDGWFTLEGGKGFDAALRPVLSEGNGGTLLAVKVVYSGSNYPTDPIAYTSPNSKPLDVQVEAGQVISVNLSPGVDYSGFTTIPSIFLMNKDGKLGQDDYNSAPPKGAIAKIHYYAKSDGSIGIAVGGDGKPFIEPGAGYISLSSTATVDSLPLVLRYANQGQIVTANQAGGFIAEVAKPALNVEQVLYDSLISRFSILASSNLRPFGGGFGGASGPDGYGLGNALSAVAKILGVLYHLQQYYASKGLDVPSVKPSLFAMNQTDNTNQKFEFPIYAQNNPLLSLKSSLKTMTQALQRTLSLFFQQVPYTNNPGSDSWQMAYFAQYDSAGRVVVNPTSTIPVYGVVSKTLNPPAISDAENQGKSGLMQWHPGMLWSGFGVSDQWNDQHYFYGYYLSTAALLALLDGAWSDTKPDHLWADPDQMGTAIDQWMKTLAYDPALEGDYFDFNNVCQSNQVTYGKYSFFDQWNGHPWATGVSPGRAGDVEDGRQRGPTPWSIWSSYGTGNYPFDDENENSTWEGLQAFSSIILWGAGTNRKAIVDQGIYLLTTGNAASDLYFLDKNYNLKRGSQNQHTWCPVTTGTPASQNGGGNIYTVSTGFVDSAPEAFYGDASAGCSILQKGSPSLNNFFYAFPTGSKFIQAYPPTAWTMGLTRNLIYMQKWAGAMTRPEWKDARNSALFQPGNWLGMAMTSAMCGVPYNPGDDPTKVPPYADRLWASWNIVGREPGGQATMQPAEQPTSVLNHLHVMEEYGTPDWSIYAQAVNADGTSADGTSTGTDIVFTAAFSKVSEVDASLTVTTYVAFNPGWKIGYVNFFRLGTNGVPLPTPLRTQKERQPLEVPPKKMVVSTRILVKSDQGPAQDSDMGSFVTLSDGTLIGADSYSTTPGQLFQKEQLDDPWSPTLKSPIAVSHIAVLPIDVTQGQTSYAEDTLLGVSNGDLYTRLHVFEAWVALPVSIQKVETITFAVDGTLYGTTSDGQLLKRSLLDAQWQVVSAVDTPMRSIVIMPDNTTLLGVGRDGQQDGALFQKTAPTAPWKQHSAVRFNSLNHLAVSQGSTGKLLVSNKHTFSPLAQAVDNSSLQTATNQTVQPTTNPQENILANTNPTYYSTNISETDSDLYAIYSQRKLVYYTGDEPLYLGQEQYPGLTIETVPNDKHLTVCALDVVLAEDIAIPQGDIRIYCRTLTVAQGVPVTLDVSPKAPGLEYQNGALSAPPQTGGPGTNGKSGAEINQTQGKLYGSNGAKGGSITIVCDQITLNDTLTLKAEGGDGYPGADGQDGTDGASGTNGLVQNQTPWSGEFSGPSRDYTVTAATAGQPGGAGGDALKGGDGGSGGVVSCSYRTLNGAGTQLITHIEGGKGGAAAIAGQGGVQGLGGKTTYSYVNCDSTYESCAKSLLGPDDTITGQEDRKDGAPGTRGNGISGDGGVAGASGKSQTSTLQSLSTLGDVMHDVFLLMVLQSIKYRYLNCSPQQFSLSLSGSSTRYTFFPNNSQTEWDDIGTSIDWLCNVLANYQSQPTNSSDVPAMRKFYIQGQMSVCQLRHGAHKTYYGDLPNWAPRETFDTIKTEFSSSVDDLTAVETQFLSLAKSYADSQQQGLDQQDYINQLQLSQAYHMKAYQYAAGRISGACSDVTTAQTDLTTTYTALQGQLDALKKAIGSNFQCNIDIILQGLQMLAFAGESAGSAALMSGAVLTDFFNQGLSDIKEADGQVVDKTYLVQQISAIGQDLPTGFQDQLMSDGTLKYDDTDTLRCMTDLQQLDEQIDQLSTALDTNGVKDAVMNYRNALSQRSETILTYNAIVSTAIQYLQAYNDDTAKLNTIQNQPSQFNQYDKDLFSYYTQQYQEQIDNVLQYLYLAQRKAIFLAPGLTNQLNNYWSNWTSLWTGDATPDRTQDSTNSTAEINSLDRMLTDQFASSSSVYTPFPEGEGTSGIVLSELMVELPQNLVDTLKTTRRIQFSSLPQALMGNSSLNWLINQVLVSNSEYHHNIRISKIRPFLVGAKTNSGKITVEIGNSGKSIIEDYSPLATSYYLFTHTPVQTTFTHELLTAPVNWNTFCPSIQDGGGSVSNQVLDLVSIYGMWKLSIPAANPNDPNDNNAGLDLSQLSEVRLYFKGFST